jgi:hypothetical protein
MILLTGLIVLSLIPFIKVSGIPLPPMVIEGYVFIQETGGPKIIAPAGLLVTGRQNTTILNVQSGTPNTTDTQGYYQIGVSGPAAGTPVDIWVQNVNVTRVTYVPPYIDQNLTVTDTVSPLIQIVSPLPSAIVPINQRTWINATLTDNLAINTTTIKMTLNQTQLTPTFNPTTGHLSNKTWPLTQGSYNASISVKDIAGNTATKSWPFTASKTALSVAISPPSATINMTTTKWLLLTSNVSGGTPPYSYQWYWNTTATNYSAISGAINSNYNFTPSSSGHYNFYVNVTDSVNAKGQSNTARVTVYPVIPEFPAAIPLILTLFAVSALVLTLTKRRKPVRS